MRTWNEQLYLGAMPGRNRPGRPQGDLGQWQREMEQNRIRTLVCLAPDEQIASDSPEYAQWLATYPANTDHEPHIEVIRLPIDDFGVPVPFQVPAFWRCVAEIASQLRDGRRVFVHCAAGYGRTGMFAVAVLMQLGYAYDDAIREIQLVGSNPETPQQREFVRRGPPAKSL